MSLKKPTRSIDCVVFYAFLKSYTYLFQNPYLLDFKYQYFNTEIQIL